jgi:hypothetical protein
VSLIETLEKQNKELIAMLKSKESSGQSGLSQVELMKLKYGKLSSYLLMLGTAAFVAISWLMEHEPAYQWARHAF